MIELKNVSKSYENGVKALKEISFSISEGEMVYLIGKSGSGKSTLLKLLLKQEEASKGFIQVDKYNIGKLKEKNIHKLRRDVGVVFQDFKLLPSLTVYENVAFVLKTIEIPQKKIQPMVTESLRKVELIHKQKAYPQECSQGEQQRAAIARAICNNPKVLIADEPTGNLDPKMSEEIMRLFYRINQSGTTILMATHNWELIKQFPNRVLELSKGELLSDRTKNHISILMSDDFNELAVHTM